jgi:ubiquinone biosynthesis protein UbiJ
LQAQSGAIGSALADFERLLPDQERILDPGHPDIQHTRDSIAHLRKRLRTQPDPSET